MLERGLFDGIFIADVLGIYDVYGGNARRRLAPRRAGPGQRSAAAVPAMAAVTEHLGFGVTCDLDLRAALHLRAAHVDAGPPDRRPHRLEHRHRLSRQRAPAASASDGSARTTSATTSPRNTCEVVYKLWEGSWEDGAVLRDRARGVFADPAKVHADPPRGRAFPSSTPSTCASPRRSARRCSTRPAPRRKGRDFAARHAECVFVSRPDRQGRRPAGRRICGARRRRGGRDPRDPDLQPGARSCTGRTTPRRGRSSTSTAPMSATRARWRCVAAGPGVDSRRYDLDEAVRHVENDAGRSALANFTPADPERRWTVREVAEHRRDRRQRPGLRRLAREVVDAARALGRRDRHRRLQPGLRGGPRELRGLRRADRAGIAAARTAIEPRTSQVRYA